MDGDKGPCGNGQADKTQSGMTPDSWSSAWFALPPISVLQPRP